MDIVLEVSEIEDYSEFPNTEIQTVEITPKKKQATQHRKGISLASEVSTANKATQTISRRVWRKIKRKAYLKQQNAFETTTRSSSTTHCQRTSRVCRENEEVYKTSGRRSQQREDQNAIRSPKAQNSFATKRE